MIKFIAALVFVIALMGGLALIMRKINEKQNWNIYAKKRLAIVETLSLDARRKAILLKRDDKEHLVILGANSETVVESDIESTQDADIVPLKTGNNTNDA